MAHLSRCSESGALPLLFSFQRSKQALLKALDRIRTGLVSLTKRALVLTSIKGMAGGERIELSKTGFGGPSVPSTPPMVVCVFVYGLQVLEKQEAGDLLGSPGF